MGARVLEGKAIQSAVGTESFATMQRCKGSRIRDPTLLPWLLASCLSLCPNLPPPPDFATT